MMKEVEQDTNRNISSEAAVDEGGSIFMMRLFRTKPTAFHLVLNFFFTPVTFLLGRVRTLAGRKEGGCAVKRGLWLSVSLSLSLVPN